MNTIVDCNQCGKQFKIKPKTKTHGVNIKETYFRCTHCKHKYISFVLDSECRKLQKEIKQLQNSKQVPANKLLNKKINDDEYVKEIDRIDAEIKKETNDIKTEDG